MEKSKIDMFINANADKFPAEALSAMHSQLEQADDSKFIAIQSGGYKSPVTLLIVSIFLGGLGIDRFMLGKIGLGIGKLLTCGGLYIWWLVDLFLIMKATRKQNLDTFNKIIAG